MNKENSEDFEDFWKNVENIMKRRKMLGYQQFLVSLDHSEKQRKTPIGGGGNKRRFMTAYCHGMKWVSEHQLINTVGD